MDFEISKITERGQVTIPQEFRKAFKLKSGEKIVFIEENGNLVIKPMKMIKTQSLERLREDLIDIEISNKFWKEIKTGKEKLISQPSDKFLEDLEKWANQ